MKTTRTRATILTLLAALGGHAMAAPDADTEARALNARWADQAFSALPTGVLRNQLIVIHNDDPANAPMKLNQSVTGQPLRLADKTYVRGFGVNAKVALRVALEKPAQRLLADIGVDRNADGQVASVRVRVSAGGKEVFVSDVLRPGSRQGIDVPLDGAKTFDLTVDDGGDGRTWDQANWCDPRVVLADGTTLALEELAGQGGPVVGIPFSFVYGGKPSAELLPQWRAAQKEESVDAATRRRTLTFTDPQTGLEVKAVADVYLDTPGVDWTVYFTNTGTNGTPVIENVKAVDVSVVPPPFGKGVDLHRLRGSAALAAAWQPFDEAVASGSRLEFGADGGKPARTSSPFFTLDWGTGGIITAVGWSGQWLGTVERAASGEVRLQAGMQFLHLSLQPGETIRSPRILQVYWSGGDRDQAHNQFRRTMLAHIVPRRDGQPVFPPFAHTTCSFYETSATTEAIELAYLESFKNLGFEYDWLDAWWMRGGFPSGVGHYGFPLERVEARDRFPNGLKPLSRAVHAAGLGFLMWFEPERVAPGTALALEQPDWVITAAGDHGFNSGLLDLGLPAARDYMTRYLKTAIREYGIDLLRIDFNIDPLPFWQARNNQQANRVGLAEIRYVEGLYRMWDELRAEYPRLVIDNCASGGTRVDLETAARSIALWRTDDTISPLMAKDYDQAAIQNQVMTAGLNRYVPFSLSGQMGAGPYHFRSGFNGGITFCEDVRPAGYPRELLKQGIAEGKLLRKYLLGDFYPLSQPTTGSEHWCAYQYDLAGTGEGVVFVFRRHKSPYCGYQLNLRGIDPAADYEVTEARTYTPEKPRRMKGAELQRYRANIDELPGSLLLEYKKLPPGEK